MKDGVDPSSGVLGVSLNRKTGKYTASIGRKTLYGDTWRHVKIHLGTYNTVEEASLAYELAKDLKKKGYPPSRIKKQVTKYWGRRLEHIRC